MIIEKKCWPKYFESILLGEKNFDIRVADFKANKGDTLLLREWDPKTKQYSGREIKKEITYVAKINQLDKFWPKEDLEKYGLVVMGIN